MSELAKIIYEAKEKEQVWKKFLKLRDSICIKHFPNYNDECKKCSEQKSDLEFIRCLAYIPIGLKHEAELEKRKK